MDLTQYDEFEQADLLEIEKRSLLIQFMDVMTTIHATAGFTPQSQELITRLKSVYFVGFVEAEKKRSEVVARELEELSRKTFTITPPRVRGGPAVVEIR